LAKALLQQKALEEAWLTLLVSLQVR